MDKPALLGILEKDSMLLDLAGTAMSKIREPKGSTKLSFQQISEGKKRRNRELAVSVVSDVLCRYPDPRAVQSADEIRDYMADVMYRTLAPSKADNFPLDQRTPYAKSYYREKASAFFYDFLGPLSSRQHVAAPIQSAQNSTVGVSRALPAPRTPIAKRNVKTRSVARRNDLLRAIGQETGAKSTSQAQADQADPVNVAKPSTPQPVVQAETARLKHAPKLKPRKEVIRTVPEGSTVRPPTFVQPGAQPATGTTWLLLFIALLLIFIILLLI